jgi:thioredoxin-related protein
MYKKILTITVLFLASLISVAQKKEEIKFVQGQSWKQILKTAKVENKNIFIDAYATWCGPCKAMDRNVYTRPKIAQFANSNFISVKIQMDQTKNDNRFVKSWYSDAENLQKIFFVEAFPTFVFLSPDGKIIDRYEGYHTESQFLSVLKNVMDTASNLPGLSKLYETRKISNANLLTLAMKAKKCHRDTIANNAAKLLINTSFKYDVDVKNLTPEIKDFFIAFSPLFNLNDGIVQYMVREPLKIDSLFKESGFSRRAVEFYITKDLINPILKPNGKYSQQEPDLEFKVQYLYEQRFSKNAILNAKLSYYSAKEDWENIVKYNIEKIENRGIDTVGISKSMLNNMIYDVIFQHSNDTASLNKGLSFMSVLLKNKPDADSWIDTYANLLYKIGRKEEALVHEEKALQIARSKNDNERVKLYQETVEKMRSSQPTWDINN